MKFARRQRKINFQPEPKSELATQKPTVIYRGVSYTVDGERSRSVLRVVTQKYLLTYRGVGYMLMSDRSLSDIGLVTQQQPLTYRGVSYMVKGNLNIV